MFTDFGPDRPLRVLLVDDNDLERMMMRQRLRLDGLALFEAADGASALRLARDEVPDLVLLDLGLPDLCGLEVLALLKRDPRTRSIPVIVVSARPEVEVKIRALDLGAVDYVTKPFNPAELRARLRVGFRLKHDNDRLAERAHLDALTGLANRHAFEARLATEWAAWRRRGGPISLIVVDLDHFKRINDRFGHSAGDEALRLAAGALRSVARESDLVARFGGEEFVLIAPECDLAGALGLAERAREEVAALPLCFVGEPHAMTASVGVASVASDPVERDDCHPDADPGDLFARADRALYAAKASGRDAVWSWCPARSCPVPADQYGPVMA